MSDALDRLVRESRPDLGTREARGVDWAEVDRRLFARVEADRAADRAKLSAGPGRGLAYLLGGLAAAAAVAFVVVGSRSAHPGDEARVVAEDTAGSVSAVEGGGVLLIGGKPAGVGVSLHRGDVVEAVGGGVTVERPGKLTLVIEKGSRATVTHVAGALVVALERGAVEAQVVPVPNGEAFAVDVGTSRVAVHGTHLRVARDGARVAVDLNEGVVSLGEAPRVGSTQGELITAPAHAEFRAGEPESTLVVSHDPARVRAPVALVAAASTGSRVAAAAPVAPVPVRPDVAEGREHDAVPLGQPHQAVAAPPAHPAEDPHPAATVASAVRACLSERPRGDNVTVVVSTTLHLELTADGTIQSARFDPPVAPDVNSCAAASIYRVRFAHGGSEAIPIDLTLPSSAP
ncbi:MAG: FecR domain-containing protein [Polyangiaceae bacterium]